MTGFSSRSITWKISLITVLLNERTMSLAAVTRYTVRAGELLAGAILFVVGLIHLIAGVPTALLPVIGGLGLLATAFAIAPITRRKYRQHASRRDDVMITVATLGIAIISLLLFVGLANLF